MCYAAIMSDNSSPTSPNSYTPESSYHLGDSYSGLRDMLFETYFHEAREGIVWGALMEMGREKGVATLVALADGTVSLYLGHGGGILGAGAHEEPQKAARLFLEAVGYCLYECEPVNEYPLPKPGHIRFYLLADKGVYSVNAPKDDFYSQRHKLWPLFRYADNVITQLRLKFPNWGDAGASQGGS